MNHPTFDLIAALNPSSTNDDLTAAAAYIAGCPTPTQDRLVKTAAANICADDEDKALQKITQLQMMVDVEHRKCQPTKYARLKAKSLYENQRKNNKSLSEIITKDGRYFVKDPYNDGGQVEIRDATLFDDRPVVINHDGYTHPVQDYIEEWFDKDQKLEGYLLPPKELQDFALNLSNPDFCASIPPRLLSSINVDAITDTMPKKTASNLCKIQRITNALIALRMNKRAVLVENQGTILVHDAKTFTSYLRGEFKERLQPEKDFIPTKNGVEVVSRYDVWIKHPARAYYTGVTCAPCGRDSHGRLINLDHTFNLWRGFAVTPKQGNCTLFYDHVLHVICDGDELIFEYVVNWLAHLVQKPWEKPGVAIVAKGGKRTGKGTVADAIREIVGSEMSRMHFMEGQVLSRFASSPFPLLFQQIEEALYSKDPRIAGPLKSKITDPTEQIELKHKTPYEVPSMTRFWFNSNEVSPVPMTGDEERYLILRVSDHRANDHDYFKGLRDQLYHQGGLEALLYDLMHRDISDFEVRQVPHTRARYDMVIDMMDKKDRAILDILRDGSVTLYDLDGTQKEVEIRLSDKHAGTWIDKPVVFQALNHAFKRYGETQSSQGEIAKYLINDAGVVDRHRKTDNMRGHTAGYHFKPLSEARAAFAEKHKVPLAYMFESGDQPPHVEAMSTSQILAALYAARKACDFPTELCCEPDDDAIITSHMLH